MTTLPVPPSPGFFGQAPGPSSSPSSLVRHLVTTLGLGLGLGVGVGLAVAPQFAVHRGLLAKTLLGYFTQRRAPSYFWGGALGSLACISLATDIAHTEQNVVEPRTGVSFPGVLQDNKQLAGVGLRKKTILGLKSITVYAFGVYVDEGSIKEKLHDKYQKLSETELKGGNAFYEDVMNNDVGLTVRLVIVYGNLSIGSVRSAFEDSIGSRLMKFSGTQNKELLLRFTSQFKDEFKLPRGTTIDLTRFPGHVLQTKINDKELGSIQSQLLCRSLFDLYIGEEPFDKQVYSGIVEKKKAAMKLLQKREQTLKTIGDLRFPTCFDDLGNIKPWGIFFEELSTSKYVRQGEPIDQIDVTKVTMKLMNLTTLKEYTSST